MSEIVPTPDWEPPENSEVYVFVCLRCGGGIFRLYDVERERDAYQDNHFDLTRHDGQAWNERYNSDRVRVSVKSKEEFK